MAERKIVEIAPSTISWDNISKVSADKFAEMLKQGGSWAEVLYGGQEYRIHLDWDMKEVAENVEPDYKKLMEIVNERFPEAGGWVNIGCAVKKTRPNPKKEGYYIQSVRFFIRKLKANYDDMKAIIVERGFTKDEGWDLGIYGASRRMLNCVLQHKFDDPTKTPLLIVPRYDDWSMKPVVEWMNASILYGDEKCIVPKNKKTEKPVKKENTEEEVYEGCRIAKIQSLLKCINPDCEYNAWLEVLMAIKSYIGEATQDDMENAYLLGEKWSEQASSFDARVFGRTWNGIRDLTKYTIGTLIYRAKQENFELFKREFIENFKPKHDWDNIKKIKKYAVIKRVFETRVCKIKDSVRFIYKFDRDIRIYSRKTLREAFENINYVQVDDKGKETTKCFIDQWFKDGAMLEYEHALNIPPPLVVPKDTYNLWVNYEWSKPEYNDIEGGDTTIVHNHMKVLCDYNEEVYQHFVKSLAFKLQYPARKTNMMIVIVSDEGTGKSKFFDIIARVFGEEKCIELSAPEKELFGTFAYKWADKQFVLLNDFNPAELKRENAERMKGLITEQNITLERKGIDQYETKQYCQFMAFSQSVAPVPINSGSRRYFMFSASNKKRGDTDYFKRLIEWTQEDKNIKAFYDELITMDLTDFVPEKFPHTEVMDIAKSANICPTEMFIQDKKNSIIVDMVVYEKKTEKGWCKCKEKEGEGIRATINHNGLYEKFRTWAALNGNNNPAFNIHKRKFQAELYRMRATLGLEYEGNDKKPQYTKWIIKDTEKWQMDDEVVENDSEDEYDPLD